MDAISILEYLGDNWAWASGLGLSMFGLTSFASLLNPERRDEIALWLMGAQTEVTWSKSFVSLFDAVFGSSHLSLRCFLRSGAATLISVVLIWLLMGSVDTIGLRIKSELSLGSILVIGLLINVIADYISLLETRWLLGHMPRSTIAQICVLILDILVSTAIIWAAIFAYTRSSLYDGEIETFAEILGVFSIFSVFFYSTFVTSAWTWAYIASTWLMRLAARLRLAHWLDVENKPIRVLFFLLACSVGAVTFTGSLVISATFTRQDEGVSMVDRALCSVFKGRVCFDVAELTPTEQAQLEFITIACESGFTDECLYRGQLIADIDPMTAARLWRSACNGGDASVCNSLGDLHQNGIGMNVDLKEAERLFRQACDGGSAEGCLNLGHFHRADIGTEIAPEEAARLYRRACDGGIMLGCRNLGYFYQWGIGIVADLEEAARLYRQACDGGGAEGCTDLGFLHQDGIGMDSDPAAAARRYRQGCDGGDARGCTFLGFLHANGIGMEADP